MCVLERVVQQTGGNQTGRVRHIDHEDRTYLIGHATDTCVVPLTAVGTGTCDDQFGFVRARLELQIVVVDATRLRIQVIADGVEHKTREVHR